MKHGIAALVAGIALAGAAAAQSVDATDAAALAAKIQSFGYKAELKADSSGDPMIESSSGGTAFEVLFYGCSSGTSCKFIQFAKCWDRKGNFPLATVNQWNEEKNFGTASVDAEGDPCFRMTVNLSGGGVSEENLKDTFKRWDSALGGWRDRMGN